MRSVCNCRPLTCYGRQHRPAYTIPGSSMLSCIWETGKLKTVFLGFHCSWGATRDAVSTRQARLPRTWETKRTDYNVEATQLSCQTPSRRRMVSLKNLTEVPRLGCWTSTSVAGSSSYGTSAQTVLWCRAFLLVALLLPLSDLRSIIRAFQKCHMQNLYINTSFYVD